MHHEQTTVPAHGTGSEPYHDNPGDRPVVFQLTQSDVDRLRQIRNDTPNHWVASEVIDVLLSAIKAE